MTLQAGDVGFHRNEHDSASWWVRFAERRKYPVSKFGTGPHSPAYWNHVFIVTDSDGGIIQANPAGVQRGNISEYLTPAADLAVYRPQYPEADGAARVVAGMTAALGEKYDDLNLISDALYLLFDSTLRFGIHGRSTCSGVSAHVLEVEGGIDMGDWENCSTPADVFAVALRDFWIPTSQSAWRY